MRWISFDAEVDLAEGCERDRIGHRSPVPGIGSHFEAGCDQAIMDIRQNVEGRSEFGRAEQADASRIDFDAHDEATQVDQFGEVCLAADTVFDHALGRTCLPDGSRGQPDGWDFRRVNIGRSWQDRS